MITSPDVLLLYVTYYRHERLREADADRLAHTLPPSSSMRPAALHRAVQPAIRLKVLATRRVLRSTASIRRLALLLVALSRLGVSATSAPDVDAVGAYVQHPL